MDVKNILPMDTDMKTFNHAINEIFIFRLRFCVTHCDQPQEYNKYTRSKKSSEKRKQENEKIYGKLYPVTCTDTAYKK